MQHVFTLKVSYKQLKYIPLGSRTSHVRYLYALYLRTYKIEHTVLR